MVVLIIYPLTSILDRFTELLDIISLLIQVLADDTT